MRKLYPEANDKIPTLHKLDSFHLTEEQYNALLDNIATLTEQLSQEHASLEDYKAALRQEVTSLLATFTNLTVEDTATITNAVTDDLTFGTADGGTLTVDNIISNVNATLKRLGAEYANIDTVNSSNATITNLTSNEITTEILNAGTANIQDYTINNGSITNLSSDTAEIDTADITNLSADNASHNVLTSNKATFTEADINTLKALVANLNKYKYEFSTNDDAIYQQLDTYATGTNGDVYIVLPKFTNGTYFLLAEDENTKKVWSMEIDNSTRNIMFSWSVDDTNPWLQDIEIVEDATDSLQFIQIHARTYNHAIKLYHRADNFDSTVVPQIYSTKQYDGTKDFTITKSSGIWLPNAVFAGEFHADEVSIDEIIFDNVTINRTITLPNSFDQYGEPIGHTTGLPWQIIRNVTDEFGNTNVMWESTATAVERDNNKLVESDAVSRYDGQVQVGVDEEDNPIYEYPIEHTGNTTVHGNLNVLGNVKTPHIYIGPEANIPVDIANDTLVVFTEINIGSEYEVGKLYRYRLINMVPTLYEIKPATTLEHNKPVIYNQNNDAFETSDNIDITDLRADTITVEDLTVNGTAHIENVEEETVEGNYVTVRTNTSSGLATGEYSGLLVNNYKLGEICAIVVDSNGTARVGHATGTPTVYPDLYYTEDKYYTDEELTVEVNPVGVFVSWTDKTIESGVTHWTDAKWVALNFDSTQALLTRKEDVDMNDKGIIIYDKTTHRSETIDLPTANEQVLTATFPDVLTPSNYYLRVNSTYYNVDGQPITTIEGPDETAITTEEASTARFVLAGGQLRYGIVGLSRTINSIRYKPATDTLTVEYDTSSSQSGVGSAVTAYIVTEYTASPATEPTYVWSNKAAGVYHFATEADYQAYDGNIPVGSLIVIDEEENNVYGEDVIVNP